MTDFTEGRPAASFILSEANGHRSRENGTVVSGQVLAAGTVVMDNGSGKLTALTAAGTGGDLDDDAVGIIIYPIDATDGDVAASYIARDAEVNGNCLVYPTESTAGGEETAAIESLALLGIIVRN
jgi:hypothetical protein